MRRPSLFLGALLGGLTSLPLIALSYLGQQWVALPFIPFDLFDWLARVLPGRIITNIIDLMVRLITLLGLGPISNVAKRMEQLQGILLVVAGGVVLGLVIAWLMRRTGWPGRRVGLGVGLIGFGFFTAIEISLRNSIADQSFVSLLWLALLILGWGILYGMKQPKWITSIEATDHHGPGYWVERGWSAEARPRIVSIIDAVATDHIENDRIPVGGIAWAGD